MKKSATVLQIVIAFSLTAYVFFRTSARMELGSLASAVTQAIAWLATGITTAGISWIVATLMLRQGRRLKKYIEKSAFRNLTETRDSQEVRDCCVHEASHTIAAKILFGIDAVSDVSIVPGRKSEGRLKYVGPSMPDETTLRKDIMILLASDAGIKLVYGAGHEGCWADLDAAYEMALDLVSQIGDMNGPGLRAKLGTEKTEMSEQAKTLMEAGVGKVIESCYTEVRQLLEKHKDGLLKLADALERERTLDKDEIAAVLEEK